MECALPAGAMPVTLLPAGRRLPLHRIDTTALQMAECVSVSNLHLSTQCTDIWWPSLVALAIFPFLAFAVGGYPPSFFGGACVPLPICKQQLAGCRRHGPCPRTFLPSIAYPSPTACPPQPPCRICMHSLLNQAAKPFLSPQSPPPASTPGLLYVWVVLVAAKWVLVGRATPDKCRRTDLWWELRGHLWKGMLDLPATKSHFNFVCTEMMNAWWVCAVCGGVLPARLKAACSTRHLSAGSQACWRRDFEAAGGSQRSQGKHHLRAGCLSVGSSQQCCRSSWGRAPPSCCASCLLLIYSPFLSMTHATQTPCCDACRHRHPALPHAGCGRWESRWAGRPGWQRTSA